MVAVVDGHSSVDYTPDVIKEPGMTAVDLRGHLATFAQEREQRRQSRRKGTPALALLRGGQEITAAPAPAEPLTAEETAIEAEGVLLNYLKCGEPQRRHLAHVARALAEEG
jgi:hypothetical protein